MVEMPGLVRTDSQCAPSRQKVKPIPRTCNETNKKTIAVSGRGRSTISEHPRTKLAVFTGKGKDSVKFYLSLLTGHNRYRSVFFLRILTFPQLLPVFPGSCLQAPVWAGYPNGSHLYYQKLWEEKLFSLYITRTFFFPLGHLSSIDKLIRAKRLPLWPL